MPSAELVFYPWLRRGLGMGISRPDNGAALSRGSSFDVNVSMFEHPNDPIVQRVQVTLPLVGRGDRFMRPARASLLHERVSHGVFVARGQSCLRSFTVTACSELAAPASVVGSAKRRSAGQWPMQLLIEHKDFELETKLMAPCSVGKTESRSVEWRYVGNVSSRQDPVSQEVGRNGDAGE